MWASPAFLKRSHFLAADYDPFAEEDFPDNERRKRRKFGRGSDQWRFAERTPSPEAEPDTAPLDIESPSRPTAQDRPTGKGVQSGIRQAHSTGSPSVASSVTMNAFPDRIELEDQSEGDPTAKDTSVEGGEEPSTSLNQVNGGGQIIHGITVDDKFRNITVMTPESPQTNTDLDEVEVDGSVTRSTSPSCETHYVGDDISQEQAQIVQASSSVPIEISSSASSSSAPLNDPNLDKESEQASDDASDEEPDSLFDEQSESGQSNAAVYSGPASDVGLDGSTFSRPPPPAGFAPPPDVVKRLEEGLGTDSLNTNDAREIPSPLQSEVKQIESEAEESSVLEDSASESFSSEAERSENKSDDFEGHDAAQRRSSIQIPSSDHSGSPEAGVLHDEAMMDPAAREQPLTSDRGSWKDIGALQDESAVQRTLSNRISSPKQFASQESQKEHVFESHEILDNEAALELNLKQNPADSPERRSPSSIREEVDSSAASDEENTLQTSPERGPTGSTLRQESPNTRQRGMRLDAGLSREDPRSLHPQGRDIRDAAENLGTMTLEAQKTTLEIIHLESDEDSLRPQDVGQKGSQVLVNDVDSKFTPAHEVSALESPLIFASGAPNEYQTSIDEANPQSTLPDSTGLGLKPTTAVEKSPPAASYIKPEADGEAIAPEQDAQLPVARSEGYSEEPPLIQEAPPVPSEATFRPKEYEQPSKEKPSFKQREILETELKPMPPDELPSTVPDSFEEVQSKRQLLTPSSPQLTNMVSQSSSVSMYSAPEDDTLPTPRLTQSTSVETVPLQPLAPPEEPTLTKTPAPPKKTSALIERLKEMRRLSNQSPKRRSSDASILDPWFAPRRLSQIVPDSEDGSEAETSPERKAQANISKIVSRQLPQTPEKPLAKSFIRSPPQPKHISSIQSSPQYLPPSQPPPPGFRTKLSYFVPLATLPSNFATTVDVLAIALSSTPVTRATSGPRDYNQSVYITDPSSIALQHSITTAQIFRPNNRCFPLVEKGGALLLRDFKVQPFEKRLLLLSTESSAWAVFRKGADVQIRGPPVEYGAEERGFARGLWDWWASLGDDARKRLEKAVPEYKKPGVTTSITKSKAYGNKSDAPIKKEIEGLGVDLPGSQSKRRESLRERSLALDGVEEMDMVHESIEAPKRVLRARGAKGANGRSESARESRFGTVFTGGLGEPDETQGSAHELRDSKAYRAKGR